MIFRKYLYFVISLNLFFIACEDKEEASFEIVFDPIEYQFGKIELNQSISKRIKIKNTENSTEAFVGEVKLMDSPAFIIDFNAPLTLQKNESKEVLVTFTPNAVQDYSARLTVSNKNGDFFEMYVRGEGAGPVSFTIDKTTLDFGLVQPETFKDLELNIKNNASSGFDLDLGLSIPTSDFTLLGNSSTLTLAPGQSETFTIRFTPTVSNSTKTLKVNHNSSIANSPSIVTLKGIMDISSEIDSNISKGWEEFENNNYTKSKILFINAMDQANVSSAYDTIYDKAMHGLAWSLLFDRNNKDYAFDAYNNFIKCFNNNLLPINNYYDLLAGLSITGILIIEQASPELIINAANNLLTVNPSYEFSYNNVVNHKHVRMSKIQAYYYIGQYTNAASEMDILDPTNAPHSNDPVELLTSIQNLSGSL